MSLSLSSSHLLSLTYTEVRGRSLTCTSRDVPFLSYFLTLAELPVSLSLPWWSWWCFFFFTFLWKQGLFRPLSSFYSPHAPRSPSLFPSFCSRCRLYHLNPRFTQKLKDIGVKLEVLRGYLICLFIAYFEKNFIIKKLNPLIRHILLKLLAT